MTRIGVLWFLDNATFTDRHGEREAIVGVKASSPVTDQQANEYTAAYPALVAVARLAERTGTELEDGGRIVEWLDTESGFDDGGVFDALVDRIMVDPGAAMAGGRRLAGPWKCGSCPSILPASLQSKRRFSGRGFTFDPRSRSLLHGEESSRARVFD